jgi:hypothetical protein
MESPVTGLTRLPWPVLLLAVMLAALAAYLPAFQAGFFLDDQPNIVEAPAIRWTELSIAGVREVLSSATLSSRPIANLSFALNHRLSGLEPAGFHAVNVVLHLAVGKLLAWVLWLLLGEGRGPAGTRLRTAAAVAAAGLFLVHPLNTQAVTYVVQRMTVLATLFSLASLGLYLWARRRPGWGRAVLYAGSALCWLLAVGSKEIALVLPALLVLYEAVFHRREWLSKLQGMSAATRAVVMLAAAAGALAAALLIARTYEVSHLLGWSEQFSNRSFSGVERVLTQPRVQLLYLSLFLWPAPGRLSLVHEPVVATSLTDPWTTMPALAAWLGIVVLGLWLGYRRPRYGFPLLAYVLLHLMESGPINLELVFEHRMYLPMTMLALLVATMVHDLAAGGAGASSEPRGAPVLVLLALLVPLALATHARNTVWRTPLTMWQDAVAKSPHSYRARNNLGSSYFVDQRWDLALEQYEAAAVLQNRQVEVFYNVAITLERLGRSAEAVLYYEEFVRLAPASYSGALTNARQRLRLLRGESGS